MVAARRNRADFSFEYGFSPELVMERTAAIMSEEFAKRDVESARSYGDPAGLQTQIEHLDALRQKLLEQKRAARRECRAVALVLGGMLIALLLRVFGAI